MYPNVTIVLSTLLTMAESTATTEQSSSLVLYAGSRPTHAQPSELNGSLLWCLRMPIETLRLTPKVQCENFALRIVDLLFNCSFRMCNYLELIFIYLENKYYYITEETVMDQTSEKYRYHSAKVLKVVSSYIHDQTLEDNT